MLQELGECLVYCLEKKRTSVFGKIRQRRDPGWGCMTRWSILEFKKIYVGWEKADSVRNLPLTCHFISTRQSSPGKWIYVEETVSVNYQPHTDSQWDVLGHLVQLPSIFPPSRTRMQVQVSTTKSDKVNYSKGLEFKTKLPTKHLAWPLNCENFSQYTKMITLNSMKNKKSRPVTLKSYSNNLLVFKLYRNPLFSFCHHKGREVFW